MQYIVIEYNTKQVHRTAGAIILMMAYGYKVQEGADKYVEIVNVAIDQFAAATAPGAFLVDVLPILRYLPSWFPGAGFQRTAAQWREALTKMADVPFDFVKERMVSTVRIVLYP